VRVVKMIRDMGVRKEILLAKWGNSMQFKRRMREFTCSWDQLRVGPNAWYGM